MERKLKTITQFFMMIMEQFIPFTLSSIHTKTIYRSTRIIYDRKFLLDCRSSPLARTPPCCLPDIPGVTSPPSVTMNNDKAYPKPTVNNNSISPPVDKSTGEDAQFEMDI